MESCLCLTLSGLAYTFFCFAAGSGQDAGAVEKPGNKRIDPKCEPAYLKLHRSGELKRRGESLWKKMESCQLCQRECGVNRLEGEEGFCRASAQLEVSSYHAHFGEERPLVGTHGSGTIFFANCSLRCVFCINWEINHQGKGSPRSIEDLVGLMIRHLVVPNGVAGTKQVMEWIGQNLPKDTYINIMSQYRPVYKASSYPEIARGITRTEYTEALRAAKGAGLTRLDIQGSPL